MEGAYATQIETLMDCSPPYSFFSKIESLIPQGSVSHPLHRFCTLMRKMNATAFIQENLILNQELLDEKYMLEKCTGSTVNYHATRLTFFCSCPTSKEWDDPSILPENHLLGYAVIASFALPDGTQKAHVLEAVVIPPCTLNQKALETSEFKYESVPNYYVHNIRHFKTILGTETNHREFIILGTFFTQQNSLTSVCAHASLRMAFNSSPFLQGQKLTNKEINDKLNIPNYRATSGLRQDQIRIIVEDRGYSTHSANFSEKTDVEYDHFLYPALESCFPTILGIQWWDRIQNRSIGHVVAVLGHTSNFDRWQPEANRGYGNFPLKPYISSAEWCDHYVISDDNYGMYSALPSEAMRNFIVPSKNPNPHASMAITIVPKEVTIDGYKAEQVSLIRAYNLIRNIKIDPPNIWLTRLKNREQDNTEIVCRTILQKKDDYITYIKKHNNILSPEQTACLQSFSDYVWITEISLPHLYSANKHKVGDIVIRADASEQDLISGQAVLWSWLPGFVQLGNVNMLQIWSIDSHIPLIRNTICSPAEW
jgi:hypothetical protein